MIDDQPKLTDPGVIDMPEEDDMCGKDIEDDKERKDGACIAYAFAMLLQVMVVLITMMMMLATLLTMLLTTTVLMTSLVVIKCFMFVYLFIV